MQNSEKVQIGALGGLMIAGIWTGAMLAQLPHFSSLKLANFVGSTCGLVGLLLLSHLVVAAEPIKRFVLVWLSFLTAWGITLIPIGILISALFGKLTDWPSASQAGEFGSRALFVGAPTLAVFRDVAMIPYEKNGRTTDQRVTELGGIFVLGGVAIQLMVAWHEFAG